MNLAELFRRFKVDEKIPFVRYKDLDRKVSYKIDTQSLITRDSDKTLDDFLKITNDDTFYQQFDY